jgi:tetratricopeptide (TPR) repeat protein
MRYMGAKSENPLASPSLPRRAHRKLSRAAAVLVIGPFAFAGALWIGYKLAHSLALPSRGAEMLAEGRLDEAIAAFREAISLWPGNGDAYRNLGTALDLQGNSKEAIGAFREAIRLNPRDAAAHVGLGIAISRQAKLDGDLHVKLHDEVLEYREAIRLEPNFGGAHYSLADALRAQGKLEEAIAEYKEVIRLGKHGERPYFDLYATEGELAKKAADKPR